jgi:LPPG:FO 2-phospho-L-lactate transferase
MRRALKGKRVVAVSPIVGGKAIKGPAAKLMAELELDVSAVSVARHYANILSGFVLDEVDAALKPAVEAFTPKVHVTDTIMRSTADRLKLAHTVLDFAKA